MSSAPADSTVPPPSAEDGEGHLKRVLGTPSLVLFGMVYMVPLTVFTTYGIVTETTGGRLSVAYLVPLAAMVFTARSYARNAGSATLMLKTRPESECPARRPTSPLRVCGDCRGRPLTT